MATANLSIVVDAQIKGASNLQGVSKELANINAAAQKTDSSLASLGSNGGKSIFNLTEKLRTLQSNLFTEKDISKIKAFNIEIASTQKELSALEQAGVKSSSAIVGGFSNIYGAVRKLAYILPGVGIGAIFGLALDPIIEFTKYLLSASDAVQKLERNKRNLEEINAEGNKNAAEETTNLKILYDATQNQSLAIGVREKAAISLQKTYPETFGNYTKEQILLGNAKIGYDNLTNSIVKTALAEAGRAKLADLGKQKLDAYTKAIKDYTTAGKEQIDAEKNGAFITGGFASGTRSDSKSAIAVVKKNAKELKDAAINTYKNTLIDIKNQEDEIIKLVGVGNLVNDLTKDDKAGKPIKIKPSKLVIDAPDDTRVLIKRAQLIYDNPEDLQADLNKKLQKNKAPVVHVGLAFDTAGLADSVAHARQLVSDGLASIGESIGNSLANGTSIIGGVLSSLVSSLGSALQNFGRDAIIASKLIQSLRKAIGTPAGIGVGLALVAFGTVLKASAGQFKGFADGGYVSGAGGARTDSIAARLSHGEYVINAASVSRLGRGFLDSINSGYLPQNKTSAPSGNGLPIGGGQNINVSVNGEISGQSLRLVMQRANASYNRNT